MWTSKSVRNVLARKHALRTSVITPFLCVANAVSLSKRFSLYQFRWFHGNISKRKADSLLLEEGENGSFLVCVCWTEPENYVLAVRWVAKNCDLYCLFWSNDSFLWSFWPRLSYLIFYINFFYLFDKVMRLFTASRWWL
jgi:hypothetical protein